MSIDPRPRAVHATAVAIGGLALLIRGRSKAGKSTLALELIVTSIETNPTMLIGDDRVLLVREAGELIARPHPLIAGRIEHRGHGIRTMPYLSSAPVAGVIDLDDSRPCDVLGANFSSLFLVKDSTWMSRCARVRDWFAATSASHMVAKRRPSLQSGAKDSNW